MIAAPSHASLLHFAIKLFLAAPCSGLPSALTALGSQASFLHFFTKLFLAAPCSGLPSALTALLSQDCAAAVPMGKNAINAARAKAARIMRFIIASLSCAHIAIHLNTGQAQFPVVQEALSVEIFHARHYSATTSMSGLLAAHSSPIRISRAHHARWVSR